jgi:hypothetical protein
MPLSSMTLAAAVSDVADSKAITNPNISFRVLPIVLLRSFFLLLSMGARAEPNEPNVSDELGAVVGTAT